MPSHNAPQSHSSHSHTVSVSPVKPSAPACINRYSWNQTLQNVLDQPPPTLPYKLMVGGCIFFCAFSAWAWFGTVQEVSTTKGRLIPKGEVFKVQPVVEGDISKLLVHEGSQVAAQQVIAELNSDIDLTNVRRLQQTLTSSEAELEQTQELIAKNRLEAVHRDTIAQSEIEAHLLAIDRAQSEVNTQQRLLGHFQVDVTAYESRLKRLKPLVAEGALAGEQIFEMEQNLRDRQRSMTDGQGTLQKNQVTLKQLQSQLTQKQAEKEQVHLENQQKLQQLELKETELKSKIAETKSLLQEAQTRREQRVLRSEVGGVISTLNIKNIGEVVRPGQTIAEIAPQTAPLILSAWLPSHSAGLVKAGMPVQIKLDAFPYQDYGTISGKVISVSPDSKLDEKMGAVYEVKVSLERTYIVHDQKKIGVKAGQTAQVEIITRQRRIADLLLDPIRKLQRDRITL